MVWPANFVHDSVPRVSAYGRFGCILESENTSLESVRNHLVKDWLFYQARDNPNHADYDSTADNHPTSCAVG